MYFEMDNGKYNLAHVVRIRRLEGKLRIGYCHIKEATPDRKSWFGLVLHKGFPAGYYREDWFDGKLTPVEKEEAVYSDRYVEIWFVGDKSGRDWMLLSSKDVDDLIKLCEESACYCKYKVVE
jgi:hypothetical protein